MAHSTYNIGTFERKWAPQTNLGAKTQLIAWYHIPEGFEITELDFDIAIASAETKVVANATDTAINIHNIGYYSIHGMWFQMPSDGEVDFSTVANLEARIMEFLPSTIWSGDYDWDSDDGHDITLLEPHVESHAEMTNAFTTGRAIGVPGHLVTAQEHSSGAGAMKPYVFYTEDHQRVGALYGKGFVVAEDKQRFVDRKQAKYKRNFKAHHGRGDGMMAFIMSVPDVQPFDAWADNDDYKSTVMYDPKNNERNTWIRTFDPEGVFETMNIPKQDPNEGTGSGQNTDESDNASGVIGGKVFGQLANPLVRSINTADFGSASSLAVNPTYWSTYFHFNKIHVRPMSKKDDSKRNFHLNTL
tara:strand:- start:478 stop:1551 length:1074 start_codon:yes stop_codon:yes gene_type:complete